MFIIMILNIMILSIMTLSIRTLIIMAHNVKLSMTLRIISLSKRTLRIITPIKMKLRIKHNTQQNDAQNKDTLHYGLSITNLSILMLSIATHRITVKHLYLLYL